MKKLVDWLDKNHIAIMFTLAIASLASVYVYFKLPKSVFPNAEFPRFEIVADIGFASLHDTEINVTRPIEQAVKTVPGVTEVRSVTDRGTSTIDLYFKWGTNLDRAFQRIESRISQVRSSLPVNTHINVLRMTTSAFPMSEYGIWSDTMSPKQLYTTVRYDIVPELIGVDGIYGLQVVGGHRPEIWVKLDPKKLIRYNLNTQEIGKAIDSANGVSFIGQVTRSNKSVFAVGGHMFTGVQELGDVVVATRMGRPVYLKDIARIENFHAQVRRIVSVNGHKGLFIDVEKQRGADGIKVSREINAKMATEQKEFAGRLHISHWDLSDFVQSSIRGIMFDIFIGITIILLIVYFVMGRLRYSLPVIFVLPVVIALEFLVLKGLGLSVNIMTLGGISAAIGIIADNAIVITENYVRFRAQGNERYPLSASLAYIVPITIWATAVSIVVFIPLNILSGMSGLFFKPLAVTIATTIGISLFMAVFVIPVFIKYFVDSYKGSHTDVKERAVFRVLKALYLKVLDRGLRSKGLVVGVALLLLVSGALVFLKLSNGFLPEWDEGDIVLDYIAPTGMSIQGTDRMMGKVEAIIRTLPDLKMYIRKTGTAMGTPFIPSNTGEIIILLKKNRKISTFATMALLRKKIAKALPDLDTDFHQILADRLDDLSGVGKPIVVNILGNDMSTLRAAAEKVKEKLMRIRGLNGVLINIPPPQKEVQVTANQENASLLGVDLKDVFRYSRLALYGEVVSKLQRGLEAIPIRQFYAGDYRHHLKRIADIPVYTPRGGVLPLGKLATFRLVDEVPEIHHENGSLVMSVNAEISGRSLGSVVKDIKAALASLKHTDFTTELAGAYRDQQKSFAQLLFVLLISIILILGLLLFIFESYLTSLAVFLGTLCSASFVIFGLFLTRTEFDVSSFTGMIAVMGIVVNNGILVIDFVERFRKAGASMADAIRGAGAMRFRPVLITNLAAIAGFLPMALNIGHGGEVLRPFSIAMISGLVGSMFFSLLVMPVFYALLHPSERTSSANAPMPRG